jgi:hypothetical protein
MAKIRRDPKAYVDARIAGMDHTDVDALLYSLSRTEGIWDEVKGTE